MEMNQNITTANFLFYPDIPYNLPFCPLLFQITKNLKNKQYHLVTTNDWASDERLCQIRQP